MILRTCPVFMVLIMVVESVVLNYDFKLVSDGIPGKTVDDFARSTAVSNNLLVVGAPWDHNCEGTAKIYNINTTSFQGEGTTISGRTPRGFFGSAVAANDHFVVVADATLYVSIFTATPPYSFVRLLHVPILGEILHVAMNDDNDIAVAGLNDDAGVLYIFEQKNSTSWNIVQTLESEHWSRMALGASVSFSNNHMAFGVGHIVGGARNGKGAVYMYEKVNNIWVLKQTLDPVGRRKSLFGGTLMLQGEKLVVAAAGAKSVYVYNYVESMKNWTVEDVIMKDWFAEPYCLRVAIQNDVIAITTEGIGLSFVYTRSKDGKWEEKALLKAVGESRSFNMGMNVQIKGNYVFTGRYVLKGAVYVHDVSRLSSTPLEKDIE